MNNGKSMIMRLRSITAFSLVFPALLAAALLPQLATAYEPGLYGGKISTTALDTATFPTTTNVYAGPAASKTTDSSVWGGNQEWVYWGQMHLEAGTNWFAESIDDAVHLEVGGTVVIDDATWNNLTVASFVAEADGWYDFELRMWNGSGGAGPAGGGGWPSTMGFGFKSGGAYSADYADYAYPEDPGDMSFFRCGEGDADSLSIVGSPANLGVPDPAYGTVEGLSENDGLSCSASATATNATADTLYVCAGWALATNGVAGWEPAGSGTGRAFEYTHPGTQTRLTWLWNPIAYLLETNVYLSGTVAASLAPQTNGLYLAGTEVALTATPAPGFLFNRWSGDVAGADASNATVAVTMDAVKSVTAEFLRQASFDVYDCEIEGGELNLGDLDGGAFSAEVVTNGALKLTGTGTVSVGTVAKGAVLDLSEASVSTVEVSGIGAGRLVLAKDTETATFSSGASLGALEVPFGCAAELVGAASIGSLAGEGSLAKADGTTLTLSASDLVGPFDVSAGEVRFVYAITTNDVLGTRPSMWIDPDNAAAYTVDTTQYGHSATNVGLATYTYVNATGTVVSATPNGPQGWGTPEVLHGELNGRTVWDYGINNRYNGAQSRFIKFSQGVHPRQAFVVFGSRNGGGYVYEGSEFTRGYSDGASDKTDYINPSIPIAKKDTTAHRQSRMIPFWIDGKAVDPFATGLNGSWQVLSFSPNGNTCNQYGGKTAWYQDAGGMMHGDLLLYDEPLNAAERYAVGVYLAEKWGLPRPSGIELNTPITVHSGATLTLDGPYDALRLKGDGVVAVSASAKPAINGTASGTVTVPDGATLRLGSLRGIPGEECVPRLNNTLVGWWDSSRETTHNGNATFQMSTTQGRELEIVRWNSVVNSNRVLIAYDNNASRRAWLDAAEGADGITRNWVDLSTSYSQIETAKILRYVDSFSGTIVKSMTHYAAFLASDSANGGGRLLDCPRDSYFNASSPIVGSGASALLKSLPYYLNGSRVDPTTTGYTGGPEVLARLNIADSVGQGIAPLNIFGGTAQHATRIAESVFLHAVPNATGVEDIQAYLAKKWVGATAEGYGFGTASNAQITCAGSATLEAESPWLFPPEANVSGKFASVLTGTNWSYTLAADGSGGFALEPACGTAIGVLSAPASGTVRLTLADDVDAGIYPLLSWPDGLADGTSFAGWTLTYESESGAAIEQPPFLSVIGDCLVVEIRGRGSLISIR